jgi:hypothetical protein
MYPLAFFSVGNLLKQGHTFNNHRICIRMAEVKTAKKSDILNRGGSSVVNFKIKKIYLY